MLLRSQLHPGSRRRQSILASPCPGPAAFPVAMLTDQESFSRSEGLLQAKLKLMLQFISLAGSHFLMFWLFLTGKLLLLRQCFAVAAFLCSFFLFFFFSFFFLDLDPNRSFRRNNGKREVFKSSTGRLKTPHPLNIETCELNSNSFPCLLQVLRLVPFLYSYKLL